MSAQRFVYDSERQRHEKFVGRSELLDHLDQLLIERGTDRWLVVTGGPGMGKSAILTAWLARRETAGAVVPHHFIRRGQYHWDEPSQLVSSLVAQIEELFDLREREADERLHPAARLHRMLSRVSSHHLAPLGERLVVMIDGLDEYDAPAATTGDPLAAFLPHALPAGVSFLCACRPRHPYVASLTARDGELVQIDLDDPASAADNEATVRAFWDREARLLGFDPQVHDDARFLTEVVARAHGNLQHAAQLRKQLSALPTEQRRAARHRIDDIPRGLAALIAQSWERIAVEPVVVTGLGILCATHEALSLDELATVTGWSGDAPRRVFLRGARELLVETSRPDGLSEYQLHHDAIRAHVAKEIGPAALSQHHRTLAERLAVWPCPPEATSRRYALRHALAHRAKASDWAGAWRVAGDLRFLEAMCRELGVDETDAAVAQLAKRCCASGDLLRWRAGDLARAIARESHWLRAAPEATTALIWNRLRRFGWSTDELDGQLRLPDSTSFLRVRQAHTRESPALVRDFIGHTGGVTACAVTPDGQHAVSASDDNTLKIWELATGRMFASLEGHTRKVTACAVTPDGRHVVSASVDKTLRTWELSSGRPLAIVEGHTHWVTSCAVTPDGRHLISASHDQTLRIWELATGRAITMFEGHVPRVTACAVAPDGRHVISASLDQTLRVWDVYGGRALATLEGHVGGVMACAVTPDGRCVISASLDQTLKVWEVATGRALATLKGHSSGVMACSVTPDGHHIISGSADGTLKMWELATGRALATLEGHTDRITACAVTPDGRHMISASRDQTLKVWELTTDRVFANLEGHASRVTGCSTMPDGQHVVSASRDEFKVWEAATGRARATFKAHIGMTVYAVTPDSRHIVSAFGDGTLKIWEAATGRACCTLAGHHGRVTACAVTPNGQHVISASWDGTLKVWDPETGHAFATLEGHTHWVTACAVTPDGQHVISASWDKTLKIWELATGRALATLEGHAGRVTACAVTPDGQHAVSTSEDKTLKVWHLATGRALATLEGHADVVTTYKVTPDGRHVISASEDRTIKIWELATGRVLATLDGHSGKVNACIVSPNGRYVVSASEDRTIKVWNLDDYTCSLTHRGDAAFETVAVTATALVAGDQAGGVWFLNLPPLFFSAEHRAPSAPAAHFPVRARGTMTKHTILFLAANPLGTDHLGLDREARAIQVELERSGYRDRFELVTRWAVEPLDLLRELRRFRPTVVHFSGHGGRLGSADRDTRSDASRRDAVDDAGTASDRLPHGLYLQGPDGRPQLVSSAALRDTFSAVTSAVRIVVLNACYSDVQADALLEHVDCVIGMSDAISDDAARSFAIGFYGGLGERESVAAAFQQGRAAVRLEALRDSDCPQLKIRNGVAADRLILAIDIPARLEARGKIPHHTAEKRNELLNRLLRLLPSQFEVVMLRAGIPTEYISGSHAPQATRAVDAIRYLEQQDKLNQLDQAIEGAFANMSRSNGPGGTAPPR